MVNELEAEQRGGNMTLTLELSPDLETRLAL